MRTFRQIIDDAGGPTALARATGDDPNTAHGWKRLGSIPAARWKAISDARIATLEELAEAAAQKARRKGGEDVQSQDHDATLPAEVEGRSDKQSGVLSPDERRSPEEVAA